MLIRGVHWSRRAPKTKFGVGGGPDREMSGPDQSRPSLRVLLDSNAARFARAQWHDRAASFPIIFFSGHQDRISNLQTRLAMRHGLPVPNGTAMPPSFPEKKKFCSNSVHGPDRRPNLTKVRTEDWIKEVRSGPGPKTAHP